MRAELPKSIGLLSGFVLFFGLFLTLTGCGYVGDPLPPALYIPLPVNDLSAVQEADAIVIRFTMPARSTEDLPLGEDTEVDLRAAAWGDQEWDASAWESRAVALPFRKDETEGEFLVPGKEFVGKRLLVRVRVAGKRDRYSAWSAPVSLRVVRTPVAPAGVEALATPEGVSVSWSADMEGLALTEPQIEVWRRLGNEKEFSLRGAVAASPFIDDASIYDERHSYKVRIRTQGGDANLLSAYSGTADVVPVDVFAPSAPKDLSAVAGSNSIELSWSHNTEADFASYRVYRSVAEGEFQPLGEPLAGSSYSDLSAPVGVKLRYRVTAVDTKGNESIPSEAIEILLPE